MVKIESKTIKMFTTTEEELIEKMVNKNHAFKKLSSKEYKVNQVYIKNSKVLNK